MKINFTLEQLKLLKQIGFDFDVTKDLTGEQILEIDEVVTDYLQRKGINSKDELNDIGLICESIIDLLSDM